MSMGTRCGPRDPRTLVGECGAAPWRSPGVVGRPWGSEPVALLCPEERPLGRSLHCWTSQLPSVQVAGLRQAPEPGAACVLLGLAGSPGSVVLAPSQWS